jgi:putative N6-adenine-specific DNA methylase
VNLFAPCPRGLEGLLADELAALGADDCRTVAGGVAFTGDRRVAYSANLHSRLASRILLEIGRRRYRDDKDLYKLAAGIEWERYFGAQHTLRVDTSAIRSPLHSLNIATLRVKDAIVDRLREHTGERPNIDTREPDVRVWLFLELRDATLYLDLSGEPLFKRGWRPAQDDHGDAPLKENMAAGLLMLAGWTPLVPLVDPFCGSGTIAIEAACIAHQRAPGLARAFGLEKLLDHDAALWAALRDEAKQRAQRGAAQAPSIAASDIDPASIDAARRNLARTGLPDRAIRWSVADFSRSEPPFDAPGLVVTNPPYGKRIEAYGSAGNQHEGHAGMKDPGHVGTMQAVGDSLRHAWGGWKIWMLTADPELPRQLRMKERRRTPLYNGAIECRLFCFEVFSRPPVAGPSGESRPA